MPLPSPSVRSACLQYNGIHKQGQVGKARQAGQATCAAQAELRCGFVGGRFGFLLGLFSSWKVEYSENCYIPFSDVELTMLEEVYGDNLNKYVLDKPNISLDIKDIIRNRVKIYKEDIKDLSNYTLLSSVGLFNIFNNKKHLPIFNKNNFNPLIYNFEFGSRSKKIYRVDNTNYLIIINSKFSR